MSLSSIEFELSAWDAPPTKRFTREDAPTDALSTYAPNRTTTPQAHAATAPMAHRSVMPWIRLIAFGVLIVATMLVTDRWDIRLLAGAMAVLAWERRSNDC